MPDGLKFISITGLTDIIFGLNKVLFQNMLAQSDIVQGIIVKQNNPDEKPIDKADFFYQQKHYLRIEPKQHS